MSPDMAAIVCGLNGTCCVLLVIPNWLAWKSGHHLHSAVAICVLVAAALTCFTLGSLALLGIF